MARLLLLFVAGMIFTAHATPLMSDTNPTKPAAQLEAVVKYEVHYPPHSVITDFSVNSSSNSYLRGGMTYDDGKLTVPASGEYYVYAQLYFHNNRRVHIDVNGVVINFLQPQVSQSDFHGSLYAGGVYQLNAGDVISLRAFSWPDALGVKLWMETRHDFFGAFMI